MLKEYLYGRGIFTKKLNLKCAVVVSKNVFYY